MAADLNYHREELAVALDKSHPAHCLPAVPEGAKRILDIGCGMGQSLVALGLDPAVEAWGVDTDDNAIATARPNMPANIHLVVGSGESLRFPDSHFDFVFSRVALPYMDLARAIPEIARVLHNGGRFWAALHGPGMLARRMAHDLARGRPKDLAFCGFVALNSVMLRLAKKQMRLRGHCETVQTRAGFGAMLAAAGLQPLPSGPRSQHFVVEAQKQTNGRH